MVRPSKFSTSAKGINWENMSHTSIIFTYAVGGSDLDTLINNVVNTSCDVKLTVTTASKKKGLKKLVE